MSGFRNPVGDEPPQIYWRRRLIALGIVVLAIVLLVVLISATLAGDGESADADPSSSPNPTLSPAEQEADQASPDRPCTAADLAVSTVPSPSNVNVGATAAFDVTVEHTGDSACALSSNGEGTSMVIRSGNDVYRDSSWCADTPVFDDANWILQPGDREVVQATWDAKRYSESCEPGANGAAGTYWVAISVAGVEAEEVRFMLVD